MFASEYDSNPVSSPGRILNRFTKDVAVVDETLPMTLFDFLQVGVYQATQLRAFIALFSGPFKQLVS
jgi:hypothetical protein